MRTREQLRNELLTLHPGARTNRVLNEILLQPRFLGYWTFSEPLFRREELSDAIIVFGDTAVLFEAKTRSVRRPADAGWLREKIAEAVDQLNRRVITFQSGGVLLRNEWHGELRLDPARVKHFFGIIVLMAGFESFEWRELADEEFRRAKIPMQVCSLFDLAELLLFVDTPWDFVVYLENRHLYGQTQRLFVGREIETFAGVIGAMHELQGAGHPQSSELQEYWIRRCNAILRNDLATEEGYRDWAAARLIDFALAPSDKKADTDRQGRPIQSEEHSRFLRLIEALAEMSRNRRTWYGRKWLAAAEEAARSGRSAFRSSKSPTRARTYVLLASPLGEPPGHRELAELATEQMIRHGSTSCVALGAAAASLIATNDSLVRFCRTHEGPPPERDLILAPTVAWIEQ